MKIRLASNSDSPKVIQLIDSVLGEYNDSVCLDRAESDLLDIESSYSDGGAFWVLEEESTGEICGTHAALEITDPRLSKTNGQRICVFKRLYLAQPLRGTEWGYRLMQNNIIWAKEQGMGRVEFWSDTRFDRAHRFFERFGFQKSGEVRTMQDSHLIYQEYFYFLDLK